MTHRFQPEEPAERFSDRHPFFPSRKIRRKRRVKISTFSPIYAKPQRDISLFTARHTFFAAFHSFSNAKMAEETTEIEIPAVVRPRPGGTPQRPISYGSPLQRAKKKKTMRSRKRPVTPSLVLDKSLPPPFDRYLDLCFLLVLFFFSLFPSLYTLSTLFHAPPLQVPIGTYPSSTRIQFQRGRRIYCARRSARERKGRESKRVCANLSNLGDRES